MDPEAARPPDEPIFEAEAQLDLPGETGRQARIFGIWAACLLVALVVSSALGAHVAFSDEGSLRAERELSRARVAKAKVAFVLGLLLPALLTWGLDARYRRGGAHARGIVVDLTGDGELRVWGRGYGTRVSLAGAEVHERLVDVYAGRLGAWRQRRIRVRGKMGTGGRELELATMARQADLGEGLRVEGGEGDCVELGREAFDEVRTRILELTGRGPGGAA
jgi:hypothetical protein